jgi:hypothetical protein
MCEIVGNFRHCSNGYSHSDISSHLSERISETMPDSPYYREYPSASKEPQPARISPSVLPSPTMRPRNNPSVAQSGKSRSAGRRRPLRDVGVILLTLTIAIGALGGGYLIANYFIPHTFLNVTKPSTPIPTIGAADALSAIRKAYGGSNANIRVYDSGSGGIELISDHGNERVDFPFTKTATLILSLYLRGYPDQKSWRWTDNNYYLRAAMTYDAHENELDVVTTDLLKCSSTWVVYNISAQEIIRNGVAGKDYIADITNHSLQATPPVNQFVKCTGASSGNK